ncbi:AAA family ATPase [Isoptericola sp. b408]|uniref:HelD family protein n=1 Tax=Isoptericola sp. b408 TaxID=3064653 RepID=UPI002712BFCC|nr:AAA family ATPase [Isoptericola sp. b408]MDO8150199.1 AAA family ATPase [Isoptericola sp. b408]
MALTIPDAEATLEVEQLFFDDVYEIRERKRQARGSSYGAAADTKSRSRMKKNADDDETLGKPSDPAAFLRVDTQDGECLYVGNAAVNDDGELYVVSWKAPLALELRGATVDDARGVARLRNFASRPTNVIESFADQVLAELAERVAELEDNDVVAAQADEMLQQVLGTSREPEMRQIVETIQAAQAALIGSDPDRMLVIQGGPGTGKTAVALHRLSVILFQKQALTPDDVLVVGPNATFARYIGRVMPELGDDQVRVTDLVQMLGETRPDRKDVPESARLKGEVRMVGFIERALRDRVRAPESGASFSVSGVGPVTIDRAELSQAIDRALDGGFAAGRARFRELLKNLVVARAREAATSARLSVRGDLAMRVDGSEIESTVTKIWPTISPRAFLSGLYGSYPRLIAAAGGDLSAEEVALLQRSTGSRIADQQWSREDLVVLDEVAAQMGATSPVTYAHIVVDEAQDLSPMQVRAVARRSRDGAMTMVGDIAQSTGHWARDGWDEIFELVETRLPKQVEHLDIGYRVPRSVMDLAARLLPHAAPGLPVPKVVRDVQPGPQLLEVEDPDDVAMRVADVVQEHSSRGRFVGVICPDGIRGDVEATMRRRGISWQDADEGGLSSSINLVSPVASKGLEFDSVIVVDPQGIVDAGPQGLRMLFVALTRTTAYLDLIYPVGHVPAELGISPAGEGRGAGPVDESDARQGVTVASGAEPDAAEDDSELVVAEPTKDEPARGSTADAPAPSASSDLTPRQRAIVDDEAQDIVQALAELVAPALVAEVLSRAAGLLGAEGRPSRELTERQARVVEREATDVVERLEGTVAPSLYTAVLRRATVLLG